jgi:hydroxymethylpyrimidine/phosphomethylpyrimidine kinase
VTSPIALTIAGSDCSGGAGLEADLKTFAAHGVYGMSTVTCVVAENPNHVVSIHPIPSREIEKQIACCLEKMPPVAIKTGMLYSASIIQSCIKTLKSYERHVSFLTVDPVMVATSGARLLKKDGERALKELIERRGDLVTPNLDEAEILAEYKIKNEAQMEDSAEIISRRFSCNVLLKGGHLTKSDWASDFFYDGKQGFWLKTRRIKGVKTHGTGCTYSAAITANLARGKKCPDAIRLAKKYLTIAISKSVRFPNWMALKHV